MKQWKKTVGIVVAFLVICVPVVLLFENEKECCLCNGPTSFVPCLIDLETGDILELSLVGPTTSGPAGQTDVSTFSFIRFHTVTGTKQTAPNVIALKIPTEDKFRALALCRRCRKLLPKGYDGRYVLTDLEHRVLIPLTTRTAVTICGNNITIEQEGGRIFITIR